MAEDATIEYRICWSASSNINFRGATDWEPWLDDGDPNEVLSDCELLRHPLNMPQGLQIALEAAGFEWWIDTRVSGSRGEEE